MAYLDHNATSPLRPEARAAMDAALAAGGNASSVHTIGRGARAAVENARVEVAAMMNARAGDVVFTSGGTEANALALLGAVRGAAEEGARVTRLFVSAIEHDSILANAELAIDRAAGLRVERIPVTVDGVVDLDAFRIQLREGKGRALVAVMAANNETGVVQPLPAVVRLAREASGLLLIDAVQAAGKMDLDVRELDVDYLSLSSHKLGGPQGAGALVLREGAPFAAMMGGGGQERGRRVGTENVAAIAGFGAAARASRISTQDRSRLLALRDRFESELRRVAPNAVIFGSKAPRLWNTSNFALPEVEAVTALMALDLDGVMVSSGSACSSGKVSASHVLAAMGVPADTANCALRISLGWNSTEADIDAAITSLSKLLARISARRAA